MDKLDQSLERLASRTRPSRVDGCGDRPEDHLRDGRATPRDHRRPAATRVRRRRERRAARRWPTRRRSRRPRRGRRRYIKQTGGSRASSRGEGRGRSRRDRLGLRLRERPQRERDPDGVHRFGRAGLPGSRRLRRAGWLPGRRREAPAARRLSTRDGLLRAVLRHRRLDGRERGLGKASPSCWSRS